MAYYWNGSTFPGHSGVPVFVSLEDFEECCCEIPCEAPCENYDGGWYAAKDDCLAALPLDCVSWCEDPSGMGDPFEPCPEKGMPYCREADGGWYTACCCEPIGACCYETSCEMQTQRYCIGNGGVWDGSPGCDPNPCIADSCDDFGSCTGIGLVSLPLSDCPNASFVLQCEDECSFQGGYCGVACDSTTWPGYYVNICCCNNV